MKNASLEDVFRHLPIKGDAAFTNARGKFQEKIKKQQLRVLNGFVDELKHLLEEDEEILFASRGVSPFTILEQLTSGGWIYYVKACLLVLTDRRILHFPSGYRNKPRNSVSHIRFQDIESFKGKRRITVRYKNGSKEVFSQVRGGKRLVQLLKRLVATSSTSSPHGGRQNLCPRCTAPLARGRFTCPRCRLEFKDPKAARIYSIFLPGGGYFYTRHPLLGIGDAVAELILTFLTILFLLQFLSDPGKNPVTLLMGLAFGMVLALEKVITVYHSGHFIREYIPAERRFRKIPQGSGF